MLSIIICSISEDKLNAISKNIASTIGVPYELLVVDNNIKNHPIAHAYNLMASKARFPYLLFIHEDVMFYSKDWGKVIENKLSEPDCGVIGFAGSKVKLKAYTGWHNEYQWWDSTYYWYRDAYTGRDRLAVDNILLGERDFDEVVNIDGFAMFVRRNVWEQCPFDEDVLKGFHGYDLDFSMNIFRHNYKNYVCQNFIQVKHFSNGNFDNQWRQTIIDLHRKKWNAFLPLVIKDFSVEQGLLEERTELMNYSFILKAIKEKYPETRTLIKEFINRPLKSRYHRHTKNIIIKYIRSLFKH